MTKELIIIGASAAGCAAAVYSARRQLDFMIVAEDFGGEVARSGEIENWLGVKHTDGITLAKQFEEHVKSYRPPIEMALATKVEKTAAGFKVFVKQSAGEKEFEAKAVILATGAHPRELGVPGEKEYRGKGISYCTVCDGPLFPEKAIATIGGGNSALESAIMMAGIASRVYLVTKNPAMKGDAVLIEKVKSFPNVEIITNAQTKSFGGEVFLKSMSYIDKAANEEKTLAVDGAFVHIGMLPNVSLAPAAVARNEFGEIKVNANCETSIPGLFAAGDVTNVAYKQILVAAGQGVIAALSAVSYINRA